MTLRRVLLVPVLIILLLAGCSGDSDSGAADGDSQVANATVAVTPTAGPPTGIPPTATSLPPTWTPVPTWTPEPSDTPVPPTPRNTSTPRPTLTPGPTWTPVGGDGTSPGLASDRAPITAANVVRLRALEEHAWDANDFAWSADGRWLAIAQREGARAFPDGGDLASPDRRFMQDDSEFFDETDCVDFDPRALIVIAGNSRGELRFWNPETYTVLNVLDAHGAELWDCQFNPVGTQIATAAGDGAVIVWDAATGTGLHTFRRRGSAYSLAWSADGVLLAAGSNSQSPVYVWNVATGQQIAELRGYATQVWAVGFSADGRYFAAGYSDGKVRVFQTLALVDDAEALVELDGPSGLIESLAWSPDSTLLAAGSGSGELMLWDTTTWTPLVTIEAQRSGLTALSWSPDQTQLLTTGFERTVRVWGVP